MTLDDILRSLFVTQTQPINDEGPGELVRRSLMGDLPPTSMPSQRQRHISAPIASVTRANLPEPSYAGASHVASQPQETAQAQSKTFQPSWMSTYARGYREGGLLGALGNLIEEPQKLAIEQQRTEAEARKQAQINNLTVKALMARGISPDEAQAAVGNPLMMKMLLQRAYANPERTKPVVVNGRLVNPDTGAVIADFSEKPQTDASRPPKIESLYDENGREYKAQWNPETKTWDRIGGSAAPKAPDLKEYQTKDAIFAERLERTNAAIDRVMEDYDPTRASNAWVPDDGPIGRLVNSSKWKQYLQAAREGIAAILRKDTGAAVTEAEWNLYWPMLFPQPGDTPEVVEQKRLARKAAAEGLKGSSGAAYNVLFPNGPVGSAGTGSIPSDAVEMLKADPSPQAMTEFDAVFGQGAAKKVLDGK